MGSTEARGAVSKIRRRRHPLAPWPAARRQTGRLAGRPPFLQTHPALVGAPKSEGVLPGRPGGAQPFGPAVAAEQQSVLVRPDRRDGVRAGQAGVGHADSRRPIRLSNEREQPPCRAGPPGRDAPWTPTPRPTRPRPARPGLSLPSRNLSRHAAPRRRGESWQWPRPRCRHRSWRGKARRTCTLMARPPRREAARFHARHAPPRDPPRGNDDAVKHPPRPSRTTS